jgi:hypothetical protein
VSAFIYFSASGKSSSKQSVTKAGKKIMFTTPSTGRRMKQEEPLTPAVQRSIKREPTPYRVPKCDLTVTDEAMDVQTIVDKSTGSSVYFSPQVPPPPPPTPVSEMQECEVKFRDRKLRAIENICQANAVIGCLRTSKILAVSFQYFALIHFSPITSFFRSSRPQVRSWMTSRTTRWMTSVIKWIAANEFSATAMSIPLWGRRSREARFWTILSFLSPAEENMTHHYCACGYSYSLCFFLYVYL